jgi:uncharacterized protein (DUF924 family)
MAMRTEKIKSILQFWFGNLINGQVSSEQHKLWWDKNPAVDKYIQQHFQQDVLNAIAGKYEDWLQEAKGTLALILLVDQFCRHIYRGTPAAFAADPIALQWAKHGLELQQDKQLSLAKRAFFYMPFEHAEDIAAQQQAVALFYNLYKQAPANQRQTYQDYYNYAKQHQVIIERFGRFPHRNAILNRISTKEELLFLAGPSSRF